MTRTEALEALEVARRKQGLTYEQLAERVGQGKMWVTKKRSPKGIG